jgi:hypothetical protein
MSRYSEQVHDGRHGRRRVLGPNELRQIDLQAARCEALEESCAWPEFAERQPRAVGELAGLMRGLGCNARVAAEELPDELFHRTQVLFELERLVRVELAAERAGDKLPWAAQQLPEDLTGSGE